MEPALFKEFCDEFTREVNRLRMERGADLAAKRTEIPRIDRELDKLMKLILASDDLEASKRVMRQMKELENRKEELEKVLTEAEEPPRSCIRTWRRSIASAFPRSTRACRATRRKPRRRRSFALSSTG